MKPRIDFEFVHALSDGIVCLDSKGACVWWNHAAENFLSLTDRDPAPTIFEVIPNLEFKEFFLKKGEPIELLSPYSDEVWFSLFLQPYQRELVLLIIRDVTITHRLDLVRKDFIANVSHELRTPLTVFRGYLELLQDRPDIPKDTLIDILGQMSGQSRRMQNLVQDLLLLSRLESVEPDTSKHILINVAGILRTICAEAKVLGHNKAHQFIINLDESVEMMGQPEELYSAFSNIIFNAVRYTPAEGCITVSWFCDGAHYILRVEDNGVGILEKDIPKITQRFYRTDKARAREQDSEGTGLGLAIVKHVLLRHNGELVIASEFGKGSCFQCHFPVGGA